MLSAKLLVHGLVRVLKPVMGRIVNPALLFRSQLGVFQPLVKCRMLFSQAFVRFVVLIFQPFVESFVFFFRIPVVIFAVVGQGDRRYGQQHQPQKQRHS